MTTPEFIPVDLDALIAVEAALDARDFQCKLFVVEVSFPTEPDYPTRLWGPFTHYVGAFVYSQGFVDTYVGMCPDDHKPLTRVIAVHDPAEG